jgi:hypothetical protein
VNVVNPLELQRQMRAILDNPALASHVCIDFFLPRPFAWSFPQEEKGQGALPNRLHLDIGNVMKDTDITAPFNVQDLKKASRLTVTNKYKQTNKPNNKN